MIRSTSLPREAGVAALTTASAGWLGFVAVGRGATAIMLLLVVAAGFMLFLYPTVGLLLLAGTIPLEAALMFGDGITAPRLIGTAVFGVWAVHKLLRREPLIPLLAPGIVQIAVILLVLACASYIWAEHHDGMRRGLFLFAQHLLLAVLVFDLASSWNRLGGVAKVLVFGALIAALLTIQQSFFGYSRRAGAGVAGGINRTAIMLVTVLPFAFFLLRSEAGAFWRIVSVTYIAAAIVGVATTFSRMNFLLLPMVVGAHAMLMMRTSRQRGQVLLLALAGLVALAALPMDRVRDRALTITPYLGSTLSYSEDEGVYSGRGFHIKVGLEIFKDHPILGAGYQSYGPLFFDYQWQLPGAARIWWSHRSPHSSHVGFLANLGLVGLGLWLLLFGTVFRVLWHVLRRTARDPTSNAHLLVQGVAFAMALQFVYGFYSEVHAVKTFWLLLGLTLAIQRLAGEHGASSQEEQRSGSFPRDPERPRIAFDGNEPAGVVPSGWR